MGGRTGTTSMALLLPSVSYPLNCTWRLVVLFALFFKYIYFKFVFEFFFIKKNIWNILFYSGLQFVDPQLVLLSVFPVNTAVLPSCPGLHFRKGEEKVCSCWRVTLRRSLPSAALCSPGRGSWHRRCRIVGTLECRAYPSSAKGTWSTWLVKVCCREGGGSAAMIKAVLVGGESCTHSSAY